MKGRDFTESTVEQVALEWHGRSLTGPEIAPDVPLSERSDYGEVVFEHRLRDALALLNTALPTVALDDARHRLTLPYDATLEARNRTTGCWSTA